MISTWGWFSFDISHGPEKDLLVANALLCAPKSCTGMIVPCTNRLRKHYSHLVGSSFVAVKDMHVVALVAVEMPWLPSRWSNSCFVCTNRLRKHNSHIVQSYIVAVKAVLSLNGCLLPRTTVAIDLFQWKGLTYLLITNYFSSYIEIANSPMRL